MWRQLVRLVLFPAKLLFGYDVFVSYRRADGSAYAEALLSRLSLNVAPRADFQDTDPGARLPLRLRIGIALTRVLVVVSTPGAHESPHVSAEVLLFVRCGGSPTLPVELSYPVEDAAWYRHCRGVPIVAEAHAALTPSDRVVNRIVDNVGFWKRSRRQAAWSVVFGVVLVAGVGVGIWLTLALVDAQKKTADARVLQAKVEKDLEASQKKVTVQTNIAESRRLARLAGEARPEDSTKFARLALQALEAADTEEARQAAIAASKALTMGLDRSDTMTVDRSGRFAAVADSLGNAVVTDLADGRSFSLCGYAARVEQMEFSPDGRYLASRRSTGAREQFVVEIWDVRSGRRTGSLELPDSQMFAFYFSPDGSRLVLSGSPTRLLNVPSAAVIRSLDDASEVLFDPPSRTMITTKFWARESAPAIWRIDDGVRVWPFPAKNYSWMDYLPANSSVMAAWGSREDPRFLVFRLDKDGHPVDRREARLDELGREWLARGEERAESAGLSDLHRGRVLAAMFPEAISSPCLAYPDHTARRSLCLADGMNPATIYDLAAKRITPLANVGARRLSQGEFSPDDSHVAAVFYETKTVAFWNASSGESLWEVPVAESNKMQFSENGKRLMVRDLGGSASVLDVQSGKTIARIADASGKYLPNPLTDIPGVLWMSRDGKRIITRTHEMLRLWDVDRMKVLREIDLKTPNEASDRDEITLIQGSPTGEQLQQILKRRLQTCSN